ncbi:hypothetical protein ACIKT0_11920, partial [Hansschlegelia beijingensis]
PIELPALVTVKLLIHPLIVFGILQLVGGFDPVWVATDLLNLSLLSSLPPVHFARGVGLAAISRFGPLRRFVMREGLLGAPGL